MVRLGGARVVVGVVAVVGALADEIPLAEGVRGELARVTGLAGLDGVCVAGAGHFGGWDGGRSATKRADVAARSW